MILKGGPLFTNIYHNISYCVKFVIHSVNNCKFSNYKFIFILMVLLVLALAKTL